MSMLVTGTKKDVLLHNRESEKLLQNSRYGTSDASANLRNTSMCVGLMAIGGIEGFSV